MPAKTENSDRPVFVLGCSWRCGSTFLQRYINATREIFIWGENHGLAQKVLGAINIPDSWREISEQQERDAAELGDRAWVALLNPPVNETQILRQVLRDWYEPATAARGIARWGFKEIRHDADMAARLLECFPDGRVIALVRHPRPCIASIAGTGWLDKWGGPAQSAAQWTRNAGSFIGLTDPRMMLLKLEEFADDPAAATRRLGEHLGIPADRFDARVLDSVVRGDQKPPHFGPDEAALLDDPELRAVARALGYDDV